MNNVPRTFLCFPVLTVAILLALASCSPPPRRQVVPRRGPAPAQKVAARADGGGETETEAAPQSRSGLARGGLGALERVDEDSSWDTISKRGTPEKTTSRPAPVAPKRQPTVVIAPKPARRPAPPPVQEPEAEESKSSVVEPVESEAPAASEEKPAETEMAEEPSAAPGDEASAGAEPPEPQEEPAAEPAQEAPAAETDGETVDGSMEPAATESKDEGSSGTEETPAPEIETPETADESAAPAAVDPPAEGTATPEPEDADSGQEAKAQEDAQQEEAKQESVQQEGVQQEEAHAAAPEPKDEVMDLLKRAIGQEKKAPPAKQAEPEAAPVAEPEPSADSATEEASSEDSPEPSDSAESTKEAPAEESAPEQPAEESAGETKASGDEQAAKNPKTEKLPADEKPTKPGAKNDGDDNRGTIVSAKDRERLKIRVEERKATAQFHLSEARNLLRVRDFEGMKKEAAKALELDPGLKTEIDDIHSRAALIQKGRKN